MGSRWRALVTLGFGGIVGLLGLSVVLEPPRARAQAGAADAEARIARLALLDLRGDLVTVRYSAGALHRASQVQDSFELLAGDFARWSDAASRLGVLLLSRDDWERAGIRMPYGLPARVHGSSVAVPAWGDDGTVELWGRLLGWDLPVADDVPMRSTPDEAAGLVAADLLGLFEGARILLEQAGYRGSEPWIGEVAAHTVAAAVVARAPGAGLDGAARLYRSLAADRAAEPLPLAAYQSGLTLEDWLWFQARFFDAARRIVDAEKRGAGRSIVKLVRRSGGELGRSELLGRYPMLERWLREGFTAPSG